MNKVKGYLFVFILFVFIIGGYILMSKSNDAVQNTELKDIKKENNNNDIRIDSSKDYIYFSDNNLVENELDIEYMNVNINFKDENNIADMLNKETSSMESSLSYDDEIDDNSYNKLSFAEYKKYFVYTYDNFLSLVVNYYTFNREDLVSFEKCKTYIFDLSNGKLLDTSDILSHFNKTEDDIDKIIKEYLDGQALLDGGEQINIDDTINVNNEYNFYVDKIGRLSLSIIVKSDQKDYNDIVIID